MVTLITRGYTDWLHWRNYFLSISVEIENRDFLTAFI